MLVVKPVLLICMEGLQNPQGEQPAPTTSLFKDCTIYKILP